MRSFTEHSTGGSMKIKGYYERVIGGNPWCTEIAPGDEIHLFNGQLFIVRNASECCAALLVLVENDDASAERMVDSFSIESVNEAQKIISQVTESTLLRYEFVQDFELIKTNDGPMPIVRFLRTPYAHVKHGDAFCLDAGNLYLLRPTGNEWTIVPIQFIGEGDSSHDSVKVLSREHMEQMIRCISADLSYIMLDDLPDACGQECLYVALVVGIEGPPEEYFIQAQS